jgi:hypothetical protein
MAQVQLYAGGGDEFLRASRLHDATSNTYFFAAAVAARLRTLAGDDVAGATWPLTLQRVPGGRGAYRGVVPGGVTLTPNEGYRVTLTADDGATQATWELVVTAAAGVLSGSASVVVLEVTPWSDEPATFGDHALAVAQMAAAPWSDAAETFGSHVITQV